jgi:hypothetical protein
MGQPAGLPTFYLCGHDYVMESKRLRTQAQNAPARELLHDMERTISSRDQTIRELEEQVKNLQLELSREQGLNLEQAWEIGRHITANAQLRKKSQEWA